jgi:hypothetical protein
MEQLPSSSMGNPPAVGPSVKYVTECKKYRYGGVIARKFFLYAFDLIEQCFESGQPAAAAGRLSARRKP